MQDNPDLLVQLMTERSGSDASTWKAEASITSHSMTTDRTSSFEKSGIRGRRQIKAMQTQVNKLGKLPYSTASKKPSAKVSSPSEHVDVRVKPGRKVVFTADCLKTQRARLGFTQEQMGQLLEVSALSIWKWESGGAAPRASRVPAILQKLSLGKREALALVTSKVD